jgi:asparagine synthase (glutamine-hydrolysing)
MWDEAGRYGLVFNGEIYNFQDLRTELSGLGHRFTTDHSDTEVIVHGFEEWGSEIFDRLNGMFAIAIWDRVEGRLTLARDRMGEKPLYLASLRGGGWAFASELKALLIHPAVDRSIDYDALEEFLAFDFILGPKTILKSVSKLPAGHVAAIDLAGIRIEPYWLPAFEQTNRTDSEVLEELDSLLSKSVAMRMVADVPVGLFLSGGLDSATVGYYMARHSPRVRAFSIGFENPAYDESADARLAAAHLGLSHDLHVFSHEEVRDLVPQVTELLDEPMGDQSVFPTYLLSVVTRRHVKVALGGDGSDELFMGYRAYQALKAGWLLANSPIGPVVRRLGGLLPEAGPLRLRRALRLVKSLRRTEGERLLGHIGSFHGDSRWVLSPEIRRGLATSVFDGARGELDRVLTPKLNSANQTIGTYLRAYLQEDILVKVDRASMATSLEVRSPFLDPALIDFALSLRPGQKLRGMRGKDPLRRLMRGRLPDRIIDRRKHGFRVPLSEWMRGPLAPLVTSYLSGDRLAASGTFDPRAVASIIGRHQRGDDDAGNQLWLLLQFEMWRERWLLGTLPPSA